MTMMFAAADVSNNRQRVFDPFLPVNARQATSDVTIVNQLLNFGSPILISNYPLLASCVASLSYNGNVSRAIIDSLQ
jgi:hypothetical protein